MLSNYGREERVWYDTAQLCINGHHITDFATSKPSDKQDFCDKCGAPTITTCQNESCNAPIRGFQHNGGGGFSFKYIAPSFCQNCGKMYPWTATRFNAAQELVAELNLSNEEKDELKRSIQDLIQDSPRTQLAAFKFKKIVAKAGPEAAAVLKDALTDILSGTAKKALYSE